MNNIVEEVTSKSYRLKIFITCSFSEFETNSFHFNIYKLFCKFLLERYWEPFKGNQFIIEPKTVEHRTYSNDSSSNVINLFFQFPITEENNKNIVFLHLYKKLFLPHFNKCFPKKEGISCASDLLISTNLSYVEISFFVESKNLRCEEIEERILKLIEDVLELLQGIFEPVFQNEKFGEWVLEISPNYNDGERILSSVIENVKN